ncbi:Alpha/Beta hydrolase protein [Macrophomina phaseolina]|uniref:Alpha/Beta hydrolase protein n=1 Tax=Macrophomina phaseolina TaxID=35725 RepID=A0ABQ8GDP2_9PEZI|nr:Alpha/Beta hydrolase protein [Macrophomina phaseolina]
MPAYDLTQPLLTSNGNTSRPLPSPPIRFPANLFHFLTVWALKTLFHAYTTALSLLSHLHLRPRPNLTKTYASAPHSPVHLFLPPAASSTATPPLLISLHGGAFTLGAPALDHPDACAYATTHHIAVACIGYRLAPLHRTRVAVCGYSAGANLALAATQLLPSPSARVRGVVAFYPVVDFSLDHAERVRRARAGPARGAPFQHFGWVRWAYVPEGQDLRDPLLSPVYAERAGCRRRCVW